jgi:PAS domain S-box-containing protein
LSVVATDAAFEEAVAFFEQAFPLTARDALAVVGQGISIITPDLRIVWANAPLQAWAGPLEEIRGRFCYEVYQRRSGVCPDCPSVRALAEGGCASCLQPGFAVDGSPLWFELTATAVADAAGAPRLVIEVAADITETLRRQERERLLTTLLDHTPLMTVITDTEGVITDASAATAAYFGRSREDLIGRPFTALLSAETPPEEARRLLEAARGAGWSGQLRLAPAGGEERWGDVFVAPVRDPAGRLTGLIGFATDVTERRRAEADRDQLLYDLRQRVKELRCLYEMAALIERALPPDELIQEIADLLPAAWQYSETACARISFEGGDYRSRGFRETPWMQAAPIRLHGEGVGLVQVGYLERMPPGDDGPFMEQERILIEIVAERLSRVIERQQAEQALRESERRYRLLAENVTDVIWTADLNLRFTYLSPSLTRLYGYAIEEGLDLTLEQMLTPASLEAARQALEEEFALERSGRGDPSRSRTLELEQIRKDGSTVWTETTAAFLRDGDGRAVGVVGVSRDITQRREAERAAATLKQQIEFILGATRTGLDILDSEFNIRYIDPKWQEVYGDPAGRKCYDYFMGRSQSCPGCGIAKALGTRQVTVTEEILVKEGNRPIQVTTIPFQDENGEWLVAEVNVDITERKRAEQALRESERRYRHLFQHLNDAVFVADPDTGLILDANAAAERLTGYSRDELLGMHQSRLHPAGQSEAYRDRFRRHIAERTAADYDAEIARKDGTVVPVYISAAVAEVGGQQVIQAIFRDVTERQRMEDALRRSEALNRGLVEHLPQRIFLKDRDLVYVSCNASYARDLGIEPAQIAGKDDFAFYPRELAEAYRADDRAVIASETLKDIEESYLTSGEELWVHTIKVPYRDEQGRVVGVLGIFEDVTERRRAEADRDQLLHDLRERVKELRCLYEMAALIERALPPDELLQEIANLLPAAWQYPEMACARISFEGGDYRSPGFRETPWMLAAPIRLEGEDAGLLQVGYLEPTSESEEGPFLAEERILIEIVGERLGRVIERQQVEQALRESRERFRALTESTSDWIWEVDAAGVYTYASPKVKELLGYDSEEIVGKTPFDLMPPQEARRAAAELSTITGAHRPFAGFEHANLHKDGRLVVLETSGVPVFDASGRFRGYRGIDRDITERKRVEAALSDSQQKLQTIVDNLSVGVALISPEMTILDLNSVMRRWFPHINPERHPLCYRALDPGADGPCPGCPIVQVLADGNVHEATLEKTVGGQARSLRVVASPVRDATGRITAVIDMVEDITERKRVEQALRESEQRYRLLAENVSDVICTTNLDMRPTYLSASVERLLGYTVEEAMQRNVLDHMTPASHEAARKGVEGDLASPPFAATPNPDHREEGPQAGRHGPAPARRLELELYRKDGSTVWTEINASILRDADGQAVGTVAVFRDISERKRVEAALQERQKSLEASSARQAAMTKEMEQFLYLVSHDLRSPLVTIEGFASRLLTRHAEQCGEEARHALERIRAAVDSMARLIESLLRLSRTHTCELHPTTLDMNEVVGDVARDLEQQAADAGVRFEIQPNLPAARGDRDAAYQILLNLASNAVKYHADTDPVVWISGQPCDEGVEFTVRDNGIGIEADQLDRIFLMFTRADPSRPGLGIGLAGAKRLVERQGGRVWAETVRGQGSAFHFILPHQEAPDATSPSPAA